MFLNFLMKLMLYKFFSIEIPETVIFCSMYEGHSFLVHDLTEGKTEHLIPT